MVYLIRHGRFAWTTPFSADPETRLRRGQPVVVRSPRRRSEIGEVLLELPTRAAAEAVRIVRPARAEDLDRLARTEQARRRDLRLCEEFLQVPTGPLAGITLLDLDVSLDEDLTILYVLGGEPADLPRLRNRLQERLGRDVSIERIATGSEPDFDLDLEASCGSCGGSCGASPDPDAASHLGSSGCGSCASGCGLKDLAFTRPSRTIAPTR